MRPAAAFLPVLLASGLAAAGLFFVAVPTAHAGQPTVTIQGKIQQTPRRIVSINPCVDALLMKLADARQIAAISHYSHDARATSIPLRQALRFKATSGSAEEILATRPDLVVGSSIVPLATKQALKRRNIPLVQLSIPQSIAESKAQISELSIVLGTTQRGEKLNRAIDRAFSSSRAGKGAPIPALIWRSGGLVPGAGTLPDEIMRHTGFQNVSSSYGLKQWDILPLEKLVARPPSVIFSNPGSAGKHRGDRMLSHPVIDRLSHRITIVDYPSRLLNCAGPSLIEALETMARARETARASQ
ncbi:MAG: ABC transporter substrate-binding protein [Pseudomonadota bacterium]